MAANSQKKSQTKIFVYSQPATAILFMAFLVGCGGQQAEVSENTLSQSESSVSENPPPNTNEEASDEASNEVYNKTNNKASSKVSDDEHNKTSKGLHTTLTP